MPERHAQFPTAVQAGLLIVALFVTEVVVGALLHDMNGLLGLGNGALEALDVLIANGLVLSTLLQFKGLGHRELIHSSSQSAGATFWLLLPPILLLTPALVMTLGQFNEWLARWLPPSAWEEAAFEQMLDGSLPTIVATCVLAPVVEEMLFRGIVLRSFLLQYPRGAAIAGSAILFGFAHLNLHQFLVAVVLGALSGHLYERTRSLLPCISLHAAFNTAVTWLALAWPAEAGGDDNVDLPAIGWAVILAGGAAGAWLLHRLLRKPC